MQRKTVRKWYWVWEFEKEERWLNTMAQSGWLLDRVGFCTYQFVACEPDTYTVRLEMKAPDKEYLDFMEQTGAEYVGRIAMWIFFRKRTALGDFDLFSDLDSKIAHLNRIGRVLWIVALANLVIGIINSLNPAAPTGWINLLCATLLAYALGRIHGQKEALETRRLLLE